MPPFLAPFPPSCRITPFPRQSANTFRIDLLHHPNSPMGTVPSRAHRATNSLPWRLASIEEVLESLLLINFQSVRMVAIVFARNNLDVHLCGFLTMRPEQPAIPGKGRLASLLTGRGQNAHSALGQTMSQESGALPFESE